MTSLIPQQLSDMFTKDSIRLGLLQMAAGAGNVS
jgi:hypothetical protein